MGIRERWVEDTPYLARRAQVSLKADLTDTPKQGSVEIILKYNFNRALLPSISLTLNETFPLKSIKQINCLLAGCAGSPHSWIISSGFLRVDCLGCSAIRSKSNSFSKLLYSWVAVLFFTCVDVDVNMRSTSRYFIIWNAFNASCIEAANTSICNNTSSECEYTAIVCG